LAHHRRSDRSYRPRHSHSRRRKQAAIGAAALIVTASAAGLLSSAGAPEPVQAATVADQVHAGQLQFGSLTTGIPGNAGNAGAVRSAPGSLKPVAGLDPVEMGNALVIVRVGQQKGVPQHAMVIAMATALQESDLYNIANARVPESLKYPHQGAASDHDSVGLFQQRASQGWGSVKQLMNPASAAALFYDRLMRVDGWQSMKLTDAAQAVQRSGFPGAYQKHQSRAEQIVGSLLV
jgi:hypothetical protein